MQRVLNAYEDFRTIARERAIQPPVIFGGTAVFLCTRPEHFRPYATTVAMDLDLIISPDSRQQWSESLANHFEYEDTEHFRGWSLKLRRGEVDVDLMAVDEMRIPGFAGPVALRFDLRQFPPMEVVFGERTYLTLSPALHVAFKLLLWRGRRQGKHDPDDVTALLLCQPVSCEQLKQAIRCPPAYWPELFSILRDRVSLLARRHPQSAVERLYHELCEILQ
ncbi:MAG: hypothetical protein Q9P90_06495 [candidate division KSB1 bacterium]|nr:hypothetical protein [candidate division KSB1 bacterium]